MGNVIYKQLDYQKLILKSEKKINILKNKSKTCLNILALNASFYEDLTIILLYDFMMILLYDQKLYFDEISDVEKFFDIIGSKMRFKRNYIYLYELVNCKINLTMLSPQFPNHYIHFINNSIHINKL